jgi:hypothetical protein
VILGPGSHLIHVNRDRSIYSPFTTIKAFLTPVPAPIVTVRDEIDRLFVFRPVEKLLLILSLFIATHAIFQLSDGCHITSERAVNLYVHVCLVLMALAGRVLLRATPAATRVLRFKVISKRPMILLSECHALDEGAITTNLNILPLMRSI